MDHTDDRPEGLAHLVKDAAQCGPVIDIGGEVSRGGALLFGRCEGGPHLPLSEQAVGRRPSLRQGDRLTTSLRRSHQCGGDLGGRGAGRFIRCCSAEWGAAQQRQPQTVPGRECQGRACGHTAGTAGDDDDTTRGDADRVGRCARYCSVGENQTGAVGAQRDLDPAAAGKQLLSQSGRVQGFEVDGPHRGVGPLPCGGLDQAGHTHRDVRTGEACTRRLHGDQQSRPRTALGHTARRVERPHMDVDTVLRCADRRQRGQRDHGGGFGRDIVDGASLDPVGGHHAFEVVSEGRVLAGDEDLAVAKARHRQTARRDFAKCRLCGDQAGRR